MLRVSNNMITWRNPSYFKGISATKVHDELSSLENVTPKAIVEKARDENTELHACFEWDDSIAAQKHREQQARIMLSQLIVVRNKADKKNVTPVRLYVNIKKHSQTYEPISVVVKDKDKYEQMLNRARLELVAFTNKYNTLAEFKELIETIKKYI